MEQNKKTFLQLIWRAVEFLVALVMLGGLLFILYSGFYLIKYTFWDRAPDTPRTANVVRDPNQKPLTKQFSFGHTQKISGTDYIRLSLSPAQADGFSSYSSLRSANERNFLFINTKTNENKWLMKSADQFFLSSTFLREKFSDPSSKTTGVIYNLIEEDTNGNGHFGLGDQFTLAASDEKGDGYQILVQDVEKVHVIEQVADDRVFAVYQKNQKTISALYRLPDMKRIETREIPVINLQ